MTIFKILTDEEELIAYEKGMYSAFAERNPDNWLTRHYLTIDGCRFQSTIPYTDQTVYSALEEGVIVAGCAVNFNFTARMQLEEIGFSIDKKTAPVCEGLLLYTDGTSLAGERFFEVAGKLFNFIETDLRRRGMAVVYGTCSRSLKAMYTLLGFEVTDRLKLNDETKLLLSYDLR